MGKIKWEEVKSFLDQMEEYGLNYTYEDGVQWREIVISFLEKVDKLYTRVGEVLPLEGISSDYEWSTDTIINMIRELDIPPEYHEALIQFTVEDEEDAEESFTAFNDHIEELKSVGEDFSWEEEERSWQEQEWDDEEAEESEGGELN